MKELEPVIIIIFGLIMCGIGYLAGNLGRRRAIKDAVTDAWRMARTFHTHSK